MLVGALFIAIVAPMVVDFNVDTENEEETLSEEDIDISFE